MCSQYVRNGWPWSTNALTDWLWRCVSHMDFCEALQSYWNVRSSSVKSVCFIITSGLSSHAVNQIWAHAFNPEVINVGHVTAACVSPFPKTSHKTQPVQDVMCTSKLQLDSVCRSSLIAKLASFASIVSFKISFRISLPLTSFEGIRGWNLLTTLIYNVCHNTTEINHTYCLSLS